MRTLLFLCATLALIGLGFRFAGEGFRFPLSPGQEVLLSGTFGEIRPNHFHTGIDIKTGGVTGLPVYAVADGYVYRIKVSPYGYGKAVYLRHADGRFTVYGHLEAFSEAIDSYTYQKQAASRQYEQELYLPENRIPVHAGEIIGWSGNSGSSGGPHLHFEIREPDERIINPLHAYRNVIRDQVAPVVAGIALQPMDAGSRVQGRYAKTRFTVRGNAPDYEVAEIMEITGRVGLEYQAWDLLSGAANHVGVNYVRLYLDDEKIFDYALDRFSFDEKRYVNVHVDYAHMKQTGTRMQRAYQEPGNMLGAFQHLRDGGFIHVEDEALHRLRLELADVYGNTTRVRATLRQVKAPQPTLPAAGNGRPWLYADVQHRVLRVEVRNARPEHLRGLTLRFPDGREETWLPGWTEGSTLGFTWALRPGQVPTEVYDPLEQQRLSFAFTGILYPDRDNLVRPEPGGNGPVRVFFPYGALFDTLCLEARTVAGGSTLLSQAWQIGDPEIPLLKPFLIQLPASPAVPAARQVVARRSGNAWEYVGGEVQPDGSIQAASQDFGTFALMADSTPPEIRPLNFQDGKAAPARMELTIRDAFAGIASDRLLVTLDGAWVLADYDHKSAGLSVRPRTRPAPGTHLLEVWVYDKANNLARKEFRLQF